MLKKFEVERVIYLGGFDLTTSEKLLLHYLSYCMRDKDFCYPSLLDIGKSCSLSKRSVLYVINSLKKKNIIEVTKNWKRSEYKISFSQVQLLHLTEEKPEGENIDSQVQLLHPTNKNNASQVQPLHVQGATIAPDQVQLLHPTIEVYAIEVDTGNRECRKNRGRPSLSVDNWDFISDEKKYAKENNLDLKNELAKFFLALAEKDDKPKNVRAAFMRWLYRGGEFNKKKAEEKKAREPKQVIPVFKKEVDRTPEQKESDFKAGREAMENLRQCGVLPKKKAEVVEEKRMH